METWKIVVVVISVLLALIIGGVVGFFIRVRLHEKSLKQSREKSEKIVNDGKKEAQTYKDKLVFEGKQEIQNLRREFDEEKRNIKAEFTEKDQALDRREENLNFRTSNLDRREQSLFDREESLNVEKQNLEQLNSKVEELYEEQQQKLFEIAKLTKEQARKEIITKVKEDMSQEIMTYIRDEQEKAENEAHKYAKEILSLSMQKYAAEVSTETTVSVVDLPNDDMKGRVIGREGRNIRTFESLTGVDLIIDDTPNACVISSFDPVRRAVAKKALSNLIDDGRIHPGRIEEVVLRIQDEIKTEIYQAGEDAIFTTGVGKMNVELMKLLGRLKYRTSYGQNVLMHSIEVAMLAGKLAAEIGENEILARRAGLLHDIGKAIDHEVEGSHVDIGVDLARRYNEPKEVIDAIKSHHATDIQKEAETVIAVLVAAADALSASRPGARNESVENYVQRLTKLEDLAKETNGVDKAYAIQAGREIRVIVKPNEIDDLQTLKIAREIKENIENNLTYPGTIKVTVIREIRATEEAK